MRIELYDPHASAAIVDHMASPAGEFHFVSSDGRRIACERWDSRGRVDGVIQIAHGMGERMGRYRDTIGLLVSAGMTVYGNDHRGHGRTAVTAGALGDFGAGGFDLLVEDMVQLTRIARAEQPGVPFILLGHCMGSFAAQQYVLAHSRDIDGLILSGSGALDCLTHLAKAAATDANVLNAQFEPARTPCDWLSRDGATVDAFTNDPLCFALLQPASFASLLEAGQRLRDPLALRRISRDLPIYLFSGTDDPIGLGLAGVDILVERYRTAGLRRISHDFYVGGRHDMLNEINRGQVRAYLLDWIWGVLRGEKGHLGPRQSLRISL